MEEVVDDYFLQVANSRTFVNVDRSYIDDQGNWTKWADGQGIRLFKTAPTEGGEIKLRMVENNSETYENYLVFNTPTNQGGKLEASINIDKYTLTLAGQTQYSEAGAAIEAYSSPDTSARQRSLLIYGKSGEGSKLRLENPIFGMLLGGDLDFNISSVDEISIKKVPLANQEEKVASNPLRGGILLVQNHDWPEDGQPNTNLTIKDNKVFEIGGENSAGNIAHALSSYGNNLLEVNSDRITIQTNVNGYAPNASTSKIPYVSYGFNSLINGSGKIYLTALKDGITLKGRKRARDYR